MIKMNLNGTTYYVGDGIELRRIWRKAVYRKNYYSLYTEEPRYNVAGTYCIYFDDNGIHWDNFNKVVRDGLHNYNKQIPYYRWFHGIEGGMQDAKLIYEDRKHRF